MKARETEEQRRRRNERQREIRRKCKTEDPSKHQCGCGDPAAGWDCTTHSFVCARCRRLEALRYGGEAVHKHLYSGFRRVIEPYTIHLPEFA